MKIDKRGTPLPRYAVAVLKESEADVKKAVEDYLTYQQNQGRLMFLRLQSGSLLVKYGDRFNKVNMCPPGTADFVVFQGGVQGLPICQVTFIEIKSAKGKQSSEQKAFEILAQMQNCRYVLVRDAGGLEDILAQ